MFAVLVAASILASSIVWPNYARSSSSPWLITWPRLSPAWFFGLRRLGLAARGDRTARLARSGVQDQAWLSSHAEPAHWFAAWLTAILVAVTLVVVLGPQPDGGETRGSGSAGA